MSKSLPYSAGQRVVPAKEAAFSRVLPMQMLSLPPRP
jgi:hypothetical protein